MVVRKNEYENAGPFQQRISGKLATQGEPCPFLGWSHAPLVDSVFDSSSGLNRHALTETLARGVPRRIRKSMHLCPSVKLPEDRVENLPVLDE